ncbi:MAG: hypothetical protein GF388_03000, partial [Candidatus Aegiribacteria sp.]|nr:hypothetical protein [Candidatus Aegiribacteria sp.]MBD3294245.1 hypothetical protein [Candidatus Fermentibacteria bacterium]
MRKWQRWIIRGTALITIRWDRLKFHRRSRQMNRVIRKQSELEELSRELLQQDVVALDTEFHGEKRYWPDLYLIQIAGSGGPVAIDPLEIDDLSPLGELARSTSTVKVIHSARNDIHLLMHHLGVEFNYVFDTQLAAAFLG